MKDGRITQDGKYNDILKSGSDFMELVGAHKEALSALDSIEAGAAVVGEDSSTGNAKNFLQKKESPTDQNDKTNNAMGTNGQLIQAQCRLNIPDYPDMDDLDEECVCSPNKTSTKRSYVCKGDVHKSENQTLDGDSTTQMSNNKIRKIVKQENE
ncbi:Peptide exporter [Forsythia ovata]|uniref:Peptide exporter n=1 Tax=Forsythia ovata TaxID=205694 RepID=A0ABD1S4U6_9LAMI